MAGITNGFTCPCQSAWVRRYSLLAFSVFRIPIGIPLSSPNHFSHQLKDTTALNTPLAPESTCVGCVSIPWNIFLTARTWGDLPFLLSRFFLLKVWRLNCTRCPNNSAFFSLPTNLQFSNFGATFSASNFFRIFSTNTICSISEFFDLAKISSMKACTLGNSEIIAFNLINDTLKLRRLKFCIVVYA